MDDPGDDVDTAALSSYLAAELGVETTGVEVLNDGLNLVLRVSTAGEGDLVLRRPNKLRDTHYILDLEREYEVLCRLRSASVPTPDPVLLCEDGSVLGDRFLVTGYLDGTVVPLFSDLPERFRDEGSRAGFADRLVETLAEVHSVAVGPFEDVCDRRHPRELIDRNADRIDEAASATGHEYPRLSSLADWLRRHAPTTTETTLVHGDFRPGNVLLGAGRPPEITGVLDWETAMLGDPLTELGYLLLRWRDDGDPTPPLDEILEGCHEESTVDRLRAVDERGMAPFTARAGSPSRTELVGRYEAATGFEFENDRFYRASAAFALATVWVDLQRHAVEAGADPDRDPFVDYVAWIGDAIAGGRFPL